MRVVGGTAKGRNLLSVPGDTTRPILDRVKTALFDILRPKITNATVLDLFAGTGGIGIEALSQGASKCVFIDLEKKAIETINNNLATTALINQAEVWHKDAFSYLKSAKNSFDIIFVAPPQYKALWIEAMHKIAERPHLLSDSGAIVVQIDPNEYEKLILNSFDEYDKRKYGSTLLVFYKKII